MYVHTTGSANSRGFVQMFCNVGLGGPGQHDGYLPLILAALHNHAVFDVNI